MVTGEDLGPERQVTPFANIKEEEEEEEELEPLHLKEEEREDDIHDVVFIGVTVKSDKGNHPLIRPQHPQRLLLFDVEREEILILILKSSLSHGGLSCLDPPPVPVVNCGRDNGVKTRILHMVALDLSKKTLSSWVPQTSVKKIFILSHLTFRRKRTMVLARCRRPLPL